MKISIIGSGNLAWFIALRLKRSGCVIREVYSRNPQTAKELSAQVAARPVFDLTQLDTHSDIYIFAIPDGALEAFSNRFPFPEKLLIHCAGALSIELLKSENAGILWPLYSINKENLPQTNNIPLFWEAKGAIAGKLVPQLANMLSENVHSAGFWQRQELHLSAVFVNNFVNHLMAVTQERMKEARLPFVESLRPIIENTMAVALSGQSSVSQTGPAMRNDEETMQKHLRLLEQHPEWQEIYKAVSASIQQFYELPKEK